MEEGIGEVMETVEEEDVVVEATEAKAMEDLSKEYSSGHEGNVQRVLMVLAAGHGKRLRSSLPKVMHALWGVSSLERVIAAGEVGLATRHEIIVIGRRAEKVMQQLGKQSGRLYAYQSVRLGTGHAVQTGLRKMEVMWSALLSSLGDMNKDAHVALYILPGDMGLISSDLLAKVRRRYEDERPAMMMLSGQYQGDQAKNYYGRVVCVPDYTRAGKPSPLGHRGKVIAIVQYQDLNVEETTELMLFTYKGEEYSFTVGELLALRRFDAGVFVVSLQAVRREIFDLRRDNVQEEFYLTDLVERFNKKGLSVASMLEEDSEVLLGFNDKTVWRKMESVFRERYYQRLRNIINIEDDSRFYIHENVVAWMEREDELGGPLDITIESGVHIGADVRLARNIYLGENVILNGALSLGEGVWIGRDSVLSGYPGQKLCIGGDVRLAGRNVVKGQVSLGDEVELTEGVNITGSSVYPTTLGKGVMISGSCYIFGCTVEAESQIESCILIKKHISVRREKGRLLPIQFIIPDPVGKEYLRDLE